MRRAFVAAFAAAVGMGIGHAMSFPHSHWSVITALTLIAPAADGTWRRALFRVLGTGASAIGVIALFGLGDPAPQRLIPVGLGILVLGSLLVPYTRAQYAVVLFLLLGAAFVIIGLDTPALAPSVVGYRVFFILLGAILVSLGCTVLDCSRGPSVSPPPPPLLQSVDHAMRVGIAGALCLLLAAAVDRQEIAAMMFITTIVLSMVTDPRGARGKGALRFGGALAGGIATVGIYVFLMESMTSIYSLMTVVFVVVWFCGLLVSSPSVSYLGVQAGMVFAWSLGDSAAPEPDLITPLTRMFQVMAATLILMAVYRVRVPRRMLPRAATA